MTEYERLRNTLQDELERQEKYPNLVEPHRLKALLVGVPLELGFGAKFEATAAAEALRHAEHYLHH